MLSRRLLHREDKRLLAKAAQVQSLLREQKDNARLTFPQIEVLDHLGPIFILMQATDGSRETYYRSPQMATDPWAPSMEQLGWDGVPGPSFRTVGTGDRSWRVLSEPCWSGDGPRSVVRLMLDLRGVQETLVQVRLAILLLIPAGIVGSALWGFWLTGRALAPVDRITDMARKIEARALDQRLPHPGVDDEIGRLVDSLNHMIERLEGAFLAMERFSAVASHELRSPLTTLRNTIEVMLEQPRTESEQRAAMESLGEDAARMHKIIEDLLLLARADNGLLVLERETVRVDRLAHGLVETYQSMARESGVALEAQASGPAQTIGDERWLYQLGANLIENALKFTPHGGRVVVQVCGEPGAIRLIVRDTGPGVPDEHLERVFEPFHQVHASRPRTERTGSGLGLAIAAWIAGAHGGKIFAANHPEGGAIFTTVLPDRSSACQPPSRALS